MNSDVKKNFLWAILISIAFTIFLLLRVDWNHFSSIADRLVIKYLIATFCVFLLGNLLRALRFYKLDHMEKKLTHWWCLSAFYNFITATLPGGSGEAATAYVLKQFSNFNILSALRILLLSRLMDLCALSAMFFVIAIMISSDTLYREAAIWISGSLFFITSIALLRSSEQLIMRIIKKLPGSSSLIKRVIEKLSELLKISEEQRRTNSFRVTLFQSVLVWFTGFVLMHVALQSFGIDFTFIQSAYCFGVYALFQIIPVQGFAGIGTQAAWFALALKAAGYEAHDTVAIGFVLHGTFYLFISIMGMSTLLIWLMSRKLS